MATPVHAPRINNNDDEVKVLAFDVGVGDKIQEGQIIGQVETDKAVLDVVSPANGFVLGIVAKSEEVVKVGSILLWLGESADEAIPKIEDQKSDRASKGSTEISAKARLLLEKNGLTIDDLPPQEGRVSVEAVEKFLASGGKTSASASPAPAKDDIGPGIAGASVPLTREEKGMAATVTWHRDIPATGYIEIEYELAPWAAYAQRFQEANGLMLSPLLPLMAWRLVGLAGEQKRLNATMVKGERYEYAPVNLGFTIQAGDSLYLAVVRDADRLDEAGFVNALGDVLRRAAGHKLKESEASGATIGFSSMERWKVTRHMPILPPNTALMVAHAAGRDGYGTLGATYDHRVLNGGQVVTALRKISQPPAK